MELCDPTLVDILNEHPDGVPKPLARDLKSNSEGGKLFASQGIIHRDLKSDNIFMKSR